MDIKIIAVKYEKPRSYSQERREADLRGDLVWEFVVDTNVIYPHNADGFGGSLRRAIDSKQWQARTGPAKHDGPWGAPADTREGAIQNILQSTYDDIKAWKDRLDANEAEYQRRDRLSRDLHALFSETANREVSVRDVSVNASKRGDVMIDKDAAPAYDVTIKFKGLTTEQVKWLSESLGKIA